jgi:hypothetical protein
LRKIIVFSNSYVSMCLLNKESGNPLTPRKYSRINRTGMSRLPGFTVHLRPAISKIETPHNR